MNLVINTNTIRYREISNLVERINNIVYEINHKVSAIAAVDDHAKSKAHTELSLQHLEKGISQLNMRIESIQDELSYNEEMLKHCRFYEFSLKRDLNAKIDELKSTLNELQDGLNSDTQDKDFLENRLAYYKEQSNIQAKEKAIADYRKLIAYNYNPNISLLNSFIDGFNKLPLADPTPITPVKLEPISISRKANAKQKCSYTVMLDQDTGAQSAGE